MKSYNLQQAREKINRYCAYQERSHLEVREKLSELGVYGDDADQLITDLITEGYLNEERFARAYVGGKFRIKKWGRLKIVRALEAKGVTKNCIRAGLLEIDEETYLKNLTELLEHRLQSDQSENVFIKRDKLSQHAVQKGYEPELVWDVLRQLVPDNYR